MWIKIRKNRCCSMSRPQQTCPNKSLTFLCSDYFNFRIRCKIVFQLLFGVYYKNKKKKQKNITRMGMRLKQKYFQFYFYGSCGTICYSVFCYIFFMGHHKNVYKIHNKIIEEISRWKWKVLYDGPFLVHLPISEKSSTRITWPISSSGERSKTEWTVRNRTVHASLWKHMITSVGGRLSR